MTWCSVKCWEVCLCIVTITTPGRQATHQKIHDQKSRNRAVAPSIVQVGIKVNLFAHEDHTRKVNTLLLRSLQIQIRTVQAYNGFSESRYLLVFSFWKRSLGLETISTRAACFQGLEAGWWWWEDCWGAWLNRDKVCEPLCKLPYLQLLSPLIFLSVIHFR